jgi:hypothetical protein
MSLNCHSISIAGVPLEEPLKASTLDKLDKVSVIVPLTLSELLGHNIDGLNELMDIRILGEDFNGSLEDIYYSIVGHLVEDTDGGCEGICYIWVRAEIARY